MTNQTAETVQEGKDQAATFAQLIIDQATHRALSGAGKAKLVAGESGRRLRRAPKAAEEVAPTLRDVAIQAASTALELWQAARERAAESPVAEPISVVERKARGAASQVLGLAEGVAGGASGRAQDLTKSVAGQVDGIADRARDTTKVVTEQAEVAKDRAVEATKAAADTTVRTSKDTAATIFWTAAATGIVFYALLDKDRREQVLRMLDSFLEQARILVTEVKAELEAE